MLFTAMIEKKSGRICSIVVGWTCGIKFSGGCAEEELVEMDADAIERGFPATFYRCD
jgi:hypothetical protein